MVELVILDVNGTLFSMSAVADRLDEIDLTGTLDVWFARILRDGFAASAAGLFVAFPDLARHHLHLLGAEHGKPVDDDAADRVIEGFKSVDAHDDIEPGLQQLREAGITVTTMTNGTVAITRNFLHRHGLDELVDATYDVEAAGRWKPAPDPYHHVLRQHETDAGAAALIAVHPWDVQGAIQAGLTGVWVNRAIDLYPEGYPQPSIQAARFDAAVDQLLQRSS